MEYLGYTVSRLIRISYGPITLGDLPAGQVEEVKSKILRDQMGVAKFDEEPEAPAKGQRPQRSIRGKPAQQGKKPDTPPAAAPRGQKRPTLKARSQPKRVR